MGILDSITGSSSSKGTTLKGASVDQEMKILATNIEAINQQLNASGQAYNEGIISQIRSIDKKLNYLYDLQKQDYREMQSFVKSEIAGIRKEYEDGMKRANAELRNISSSLLSSLQSNFTKMESSVTSSVNSSVSQTLGTALDKQRHENEKAIHEVSQSVRLVTDTLRVLIESYRQEISVLKKLIDKLGESQDSIGIKGFSRQVQDELEHIGNNLQQ